MPIWLHTDTPTDSEVTKRLTPWYESAQSCVYCNSALERLWTDRASISGSIGLGVCQKCGWWELRRTGGIEDEDYGRLPGYRQFYHGTFGRLRNLDLADISTPIEVLRTALVAQYSGRLKLNPQRFEQIVAGVFADFGYAVRVTSFAGDDGIDVVALDGQSNEVVGVQVKRYRNKIVAEQIRAFAGALVLGSMTKGVFVTTSSYTQPAKETATRYSNTGLSIELWDAARFLDRLELTQRSMFESAHVEDAPWQRFLTNPSDMPQVGSTLEAERF